MPAQAESTPNVILFLAADPSDLARLRIGEESREIQEKLRLARLRDHFDVEVRLSVRPADVSQSLLDLAPRFVHFSGHGAQNGAICFETRTGEALPISAEALSALFAQFAGTVECVVLNACFSAVQAGAIAAEIPYVIGMRSEVGDRAAIAFSVGFYQAIGAGRSVEDAFRLGVVQIQLEGLPEAFTPVLVRKGERVPDIQPAPALPAPERPRSLPGRERSGGAGQRPPAGTVRAPSGGNLDPVVTTLRRIMQEGGDGNFAVFQADATRNCFIQVAAGAGADSLYLEAASDKYLQAGFRLPAAAKQRLAELGWQLAEEQFGGNYTKIWDNVGDDAARRLVAMEILAILTEVYGCAAGDVLDVRVVLE